MQALLPNSTLPQILDLVHTTMNEFSMVDAEGNMTMPLPVETANGFSDEAPSTTVSLDSVDRNSLAETAHRLKKAAVGLKKITSSRGKAGSEAPNTHPFGIVQTITPSPIGQHHPHDLLSINTTPYLVPTPQQSGIAGARETKLHYAKKTEHGTDMRRHIFLQYLGRYNPPTNHKFFQLTFVDHSPTQQTWTRILRINRPVRLQDKPSPFGVELVFLGPTSLLAALFNDGSFNPNMPYNGQLQQARHVINLASTEDAYRSRYLDDYWYHLGDQRAKDSDAYSMSLPYPGRDPVDWPWQSMRVSGFRNDNTPTVGREWGTMITLNFLPHELDPTHPKRTFAARLMSLNALTEPSQETFVDEKRLHGFWTESHSRQTEARRHDPHKREFNSSLNHPFSPKKTPHNFQFRIP